MSQNVYGQQQYPTSPGTPGPGGPPPRPSRNNTATLDGLAAAPLSASTLPNRRLSSPAASNDQYTLQSYDPGDSPPPSVINGAANGGRSRSGTQTVKSKKGMLSFMSGASNCQSSALVSVIAQRR